MARYLVVANQTIGGQALIDEIRRRIAAGPCSFFVIVPETPPRQATGASAFAGEAHPMGIPDPPDEAAVHRARLLAQSRQNELIARIRAEGADAAGTVGLSDPVEAVGALLSEGERFDGIIVSTLPAGVSRWLRMDVSGRIERRFKVPITTVTAKA